jgi:hypothetical protein
MSRLIAAACLCISFLLTGALGQQSDGPLTNASVVRLVKAGFKEKTIITIINNRPSDFKLDTERLIELKRSGVNENIILAMLSSHMGTVFVDEDEWSGDSLFKDLKKPNAADRRKHLWIGIEFTIVDSFARRAWRESERRKPQWVGDGADHQAAHGGWRKCVTETREDANADK